MTSQLRQPKVLRAAFLLLILAAILACLGFTARADSETYDVTVKTGNFTTVFYDQNNKELTAENLPKDGNYTCKQLSLTDGNYTYKCYNTEGQSIGNGQLVVDKDHQSFVLRNLVFPNPTNKDKIDYYITLTGKNDIVYECGKSKQSFVVPACGGSDNYQYAFIPADSTYWGSNGDVWVNPSPTVDGFGSMNLSDSGSFVVAKKISVNVKVPHGADIIFCHRVKFYRPLEYIEGSLLSEGEEYDTYNFVLPNAMVHYEIHQAGKVKKARTIQPSKYAETELVIDDLQDNPKQQRKDISQAFFNANVLTNVNDSKYLELQTGETFEFFLHRDWQAINSITGNYYVDPDYHYEVVCGDSVTVDEEGLVQAVKPGISVIKITYDALDWESSGGGSIVYSAIWDENIPPIIVNVDPDNSTKITPHINQSEFDTIYYNRTQNGQKVDDHAEYTFTPEADKDIRVRVQNFLRDDFEKDSDWTSYEANEDGSFTVDLYDGYNIIEMKAGSSVRYFAVRAYGLDVTVYDKTVNMNTDNQIRPGDTVEISFEGLMMPLPKLGAIYNPGYPADIWIQYDLNGMQMDSTHTQYAIRKVNTITYTATEPGTFTLKGGKIHGSVIGESMKAHRVLTKGGMATSYNGGDSGVSFNGYLCTLPDITFTVAGKSDEDQQAKYDYTSLRYLDGVSPKLSLDSDTITYKKLADGEELPGNLITSLKSTDTNFRSLVYNIMPENANNVNLYMRYWTENYPTANVGAMKIGQEGKSKRFSKNDDITYIELVVSPKDPEKGYAKSYCIRVCDTGSSYYGTKPFLEKLEIVIPNPDDCTPISGKLFADPVSYKDGNDTKTLDFGVGFIGTEQNYSATVPNSVSEIRFSTKPMTEGDQTTEVRVNGAVVGTDNISQAIQLKEGSNTIQIQCAKGSETLTYTVRVTREAGPQTVSFTNADSAAVNYIKKADGTGKTTVENGSCDLYPGDYVYYAEKQGYYSQKIPFTVSAGQENTVAVPDMQALPQQSGKVNVISTAVDHLLCNISDLPIQAEPANLETQRYVDYNYGGYTALHAIIDAYYSSATQIDFTCVGGVLTPKDNKVPSDCGENAGWVCEVNGKTVDPAETLVYDGDQIEYYYNPDYPDMQHAKWQSTVTEVKAGEKAQLTLLAVPVKNDGSAAVGCANARVYINGKDSGKTTDSNGRVELTFTAAGQNTITAVKTDAQGRNLLTYTYCTVKVIGSSQGGGGDSGDTATITVTFRLIGDTKHTDITDHGKYVTWIATKKVTVAAPATVYDVFTAVLDKAGMEYVGAENNYVSKIQAPSSLGGYWLGEFTNGQNSGWMYTINGDHPNLGLKEYKLKDRDIIIWHYVDDYQKETSYEGSIPQYPDRWLEADDVDPSGTTGGGGGGGGTTVPDQPTKPDTPDTPDRDYEIFKDVNNRFWAAQYINPLAKAKIVNGTSADEFLPDADITRAEFVTILARMSGDTLPAAGEKFRDVAADSWYAQSVAWAAEKQITKGLTETTFAPENKITRQEMAVMLVRYAEYKKYTLLEQNAAEAFADQEDIADWAVDSVRAIQKAGIINGKENKRFAPAENASRAESAKMLYLIWQGMQAEQTEK